MKVLKEYNQQYNSGFKAKIVLRPKFKEKFYGIIVDFGSADPQSFAGTAHFLEHKLFAKKEGDLSLQFEKVGAEVNAFTSLNETMFYCRGLDHAPTLIKLLFRLIGDPYFTVQNIAQEKPIIEQELAMYQDDPDWTVNHALMKAMFSSSNLAEDVAGRQETIAKMDRQALKQSYAANYTANKMSFIACGDFSPYQIKSIFALVKKEQAFYLKPSGPKLVGSRVQTKIKTAEIKLKGKNHSHLFGIGLKLPKFKKVLSSRDLAQTIIEIMLESKLSVMSPWFDQMKNHGWLTDPLQISMSYSREGNFATIFGLSSQQKEVVRAIKRELQRPFTASDIPFLRSAWALAKKAYLAAYLRGCDDLSYLAVAEAEASLDDESLSRDLQQLQTMSFAKFLHTYQDLMTDNQFTSAHF